MKKVFFMLVLVAVMASGTISFAQTSGKSSMVEGRVVEINPDLSTFTVQKSDKKIYKFSSNILTDYFLQGKNGAIADANFDALKTGGRVKVEYFEGDNLHTADEVTIER